MWVIFQLYINKNMWKNWNFWIFYEIFEAENEFFWSKLTKKDRFRAENDQKNPKNKFGQQIRNNQIVSWKCRILTRNLWKTIFHRKGPSYDIKLFCWV